MSCVNVVDKVSFHLLFLGHLYGSLKTSNRSNVTLRIFGFLFAGTGELSIITPIGSLTSFVNSVNRVTEDLSCESSRY